jgi:membrane protein EpsK
MGIILHNYTNITDSFTSQFPKNLAANIGYFLANVVIGLFLVPYFVSTLGVAAYGLIPLATSITGYVSLVVLSLNTAVSRYLTVDLQRENYLSANRTFNTALFGLTAIILLMIPIVLTISYFVPTIFSVPQGQEEGAMFLFLGVITAFLIRAWSGNFTVQLFAYNRLDLQNIVNLTNLVVQTSLIIVFFNIFGPNLSLIGVAYLIGSIISSIVAIIFSRKICPYLTISWRSWDRSKLKEIGNMGGWVIVNQIGALLFLQIDLIVVNKLFGAAAGGEYSIALQWVILLRSVAGVLAGVLTPMILTYYAKEQTGKVKKISQSAVKLMGFAMAFPIGIICGFSPQILSLWIGEEYTFLAPLMVILTAHLSINLAVKPLFSINVAHNRVRIPGIVTFFMGIGNLILAIAIPLVTGWGYYGVAIAAAIMLTLKNTAFTPWYTSRILGENKYIFLRPMVPGILSVLFIGIGSAMFNQFIPSLQVISLISLVSTMALIYLIGVYLFGLNKFERDLLNSYLPTRIKRKIT